MDTTKASDDAVRPGTPYLQVRGISKSYGVVRALDGVDFAIAPGEIVGVVGHNGAGKSTLMNILAGTVRRSAGDFMIGGTAVEEWSPSTAEHHGLRCVFQELSLSANLTLAENTRVVHRALRGPGWRRRAAALIRGQLDAIFPGNRLSATARVADLPIGARQIVEIARAFTETEAPVRCVILDEPTSALGHEAASQLLAYIRGLPARGVACILITHRLDEILAVCDRATVMMDGRVMAERPIAGLTRAALVGLMGAIETPHGPTAATAAMTGAPVVDHPGHDARDLPVRAAAGEIIGLAGLDGHGQRERLRALYAHGRARHRAGKGPAVAYVAGDRGAEGVFPLWSIADNLTLRSIRGLRRFGLISPEAERRLAREWAAKLQVKAPSIDTPIMSLSGGNQQKVLFARALASDAGIILLDDPMRGVDVNTKQEVYRLIRQEAEAGRCFVWYTTEMEEFENCSRLYVFREARARIELRGADVEPRRILEASFGGGDE